MSRKFSILRNKLKKTKNYNQRARAAKIELDNEIARFNAETGAEED